MGRDSLDEEALLPAEREQHPRPSDLRTRLQAAVAARGLNRRPWLYGGGAIFTLYVLLSLLSPSTPDYPPKLSTSPSSNPSHRTTPAERLAQRNADYDVKSEGFGTGNVDLEGYREQLLLSLEDVLGTSDYGAVDTLDPQRRLANDTALRSAVACHLDLNCVSHESIPEEIFATDRVVEPVPYYLASWLSQNPSYQPSFLNDPAVDDWVSSRFASPSSSLRNEFDSLPLPILKYDLLRLLLLLARGGIYTDSDALNLRPVSRWNERVVDLSDPLLSPDGGASTAPSFIVGIEWTGHTEVNSLNPLYTRSTGVVQWCFGATKGHPIIVDAVRRVLRNSRKAAALRKGHDLVDEGGPLHFDPDADRMVLEWSGPAVLSDAVARYLRTRYGLSLTRLSHFSHPVRIGDVLLLPIASLNARTSVFLKTLDWTLGRGWAPWNTKNDLVVHAHAGSWWTQHLKKKPS